MQPSSRDIVIRTLLPEAGGLSAPDILRRLPVRISQPTLWRILDALRCEGRILVEGRARATRYRATSATDVAAQRSLHMHRAVARRLARNPGLVNIARNRLEFLRSSNVHGRAYHDRWAELIGGPVERLLATMTEDSELGATMRKESPFTTLVNEAERLRAFTDIR
ncbi:MAG: hypothetical protein WCH32_12485 [Pseudomonadota bacterium]